MIKSLSDFEFLDPDKILGEGAYSQVLRVRNKSDGQYYALKKIDLSVLSSEDCALLRTEMKIHLGLQHPHIIRFFGGHQVGQTVYFLLEYAANGCLFFYIDSKKGLPEKLALRFLYQTATAVKYLQERSLLHRDIKPENILLDSDFNVKLCDFGWVTKEEDAHLDQLSGTYEYMAPEALFLNNYSKELDMWCLGVMLYEMLHGEPPFQGKTLKDIKIQLKNKQIAINKNLSLSTKDLLKKLLKKNFQDRIGIEELLRHKAFEDEKIRNSELSPEEFSILKAQYLKNVKSNKRILPERIQRSLEREKKDQEPRPPGTKEVPVSNESFVKPPSNFVLQSKFAKLFKDLKEKQSQTNLHQSRISSYEQKESEKHRNSHFKHYLNNIFGPSKHKEHIQINDTLRSQSMRELTPALNIQGDKYDAFDSVGKSPKIKEDNYFVNGLKVVPLKTIGEVNDFPIGEEKKANFLAKRHRLNNLSQSMIVKPLNGKFQSTEYLHHVK